MERIDSDHAKESKTGKQGRAEIEDAEAAEIDHESEDAGESATFSFGKPGGFDFGHAGCAEGLKVSVDAANGHEETEDSPDRGGAEEDVHDDGAGGADEHRLFAADPIGDQSVDDLAKGINQRGGENNPRHLGIAEMVLVADGFVRDREIEPAEIKRCIEEPEVAPVEAAAGTEARRIAAKCRPGTGMLIYFCIRWNRWPRFLYNRFRAFVANFCPDSKTGR